MNHGKGSVVGQLTPVKHNRLIISETISVDEPASRHMEMLEYKNSARGHLVALENKSAMECYLEEIVKGTTRKQNAYGALASSKMHTETLHQLVS